MSVLLVDERIGSKDLLKPLRAAGLPAELTHLDYADVAFEGKGANNATVAVGIELKTLGDLVGSLRSGRLAGHQLPGLRTSYDHAWLVVEGQWRHDDGGQVLTYQGKSRGWHPLKGKMTASELEKQVLTLEMCGGLHPRYTNSRRDTVRFVQCLYRWWTDTALDRHTSHLAVHETPTLVPISPFRQTVSRFPGIGIKTSASVEKYFGGSLKKACNAGVGLWADIATVDPSGKSRRIGNKVATQVVHFIEGGQ